MIPVLAATQAARWDERARDESLIPSRVLMESAGRAAAQVIASTFPRTLPKGVVIAAGHGNNGGDGWVVARALAAAGARVAVAETSKPRSQDCEANRALALAEGVVIAGSRDAWPPAELVIDALLGTGASGVPTGGLGDLAQRVSEHAGPVVALDGPTGLDLTTGAAHGPVRAHLTVTFGGVRRGHLLARDWCGRIVVVDIGFPPPDAAWPTLFTDREAARLLPPFDATMHKGNRGRVLVIGGESGMAGAALHTASAAFAAGAGLVKVAGSARTVDAAQWKLPDALSLETALGPAVERHLAEAITWADAVVLGPGLGRSEDRAAFVAAVLEGCQKPIVLDADGIVPGSKVPGAGPRVLTPHMGEFKSAWPELTDRLEEDRFAAVEAAADADTVLLKGVPTIIAARGAPTRVVATGNPALATGGSGDLLAGIIGAYLARGLAAQDAASLGAFTLGRGAELAAASHTVRATRPADVLAALPDLWRLLAEPPLIEPPVLCELLPPALL